MNVNPAPTFPPPTGDQAGSAETRPQPAQTFPPSGNSSPQEPRASNRVSANEDGPATDEVKLHWDSTEQIPVYQFVSQNGSLILQVPSQQVLDLASEISQEFAQEAAPKIKGAVDGGSTDGR